MRVIIRDDDVSCFTPPDFLERLYGGLWTEGLPVCLSVVPHHSDSVWVPSGSACPIPDANTPPDLFGGGKVHPIGQNRPLASMLKKLARAGCVELCLHGYEHRMREFDTDSESARKYLVESLRAFNQFFPGVVPRTFVPPYEALSLQAFEVLQERGLNLATSRETARALGLASTGTPPSDPVSISAAGAVVFAAGPYIFDPAVGDEVLERTAMAAIETYPDLLIVVNHYWYFFQDFSEPRARRIQIWTNFLETLKKAGAQFTTFEREARQRKTAFASRGSCPNVPVSKM